MKTHPALIVAAVTVSLASMLASASAQQTDADTPLRKRPAGAAPAEAAAAPQTKPTTAANAAPATPEAEKTLRLNFRGVPLEMVLDYLSDAAGFTVVLDTPISGKVDVWSYQALSKDEAVDLLNTVLAKNGYAAIRNG